MGRSCSERLGAGLRSSNTGNDARHVETVSQYKEDLLDGERRSGEKDLAVFSTFGFRRAKSMKMFNFIQSRSLLKRSKASASSASLLDAPPCRRGGR